MKWLWLETYWASMLLITICLLATLAAGCNNPHARPFRGTSRSVETGHWMDGVWMDPVEAQVRIDNRAKSKADSFGDYWTR